MQENKSLFNRLRLVSTCATVLLLAACASEQPAPVVERIQLPEKKTSAPATAKPAPAAVPGKDWRPETYTVKKGDTLHSIGLEFGYDYKDIAQLNNIQPPYIIRIGQQLTLKSLAQGDASKPANAASAASGVVTTPLSSDSNVIVKPLGSGDATVSPIQPSPATTAQPATPIAPTGPVVLNEPKAQRIPYSDAAMQAQATPAPAKPVAAAAATTSANKPADTTTTKPAATATTASASDTPAKPADAAKPAATPATASAAGDEDSVDWAWPANGKVVAGFSDSGNAKGIDIAGTTGQAVYASAPGKVIYSGSDLRGYGKLVIIKHNKTYLSVYAHNSQIMVKEGQQVSRGQKIAEMGDSDTDRVKLHFEIRQQGKSVDPAKYLPASPG